MLRTIIRFVTFYFFLHSLASANDTSKLDGDWYSFKWKYGYSLNSGKGIAFATNSPNFRIGQEIVRLTAVGRNAFVGENVYKDGKFYKVKVTLQPDGKLFFEGEKNVKWEMERIDPETYSLIVNSNAEKRTQRSDSKPLPTPSAQSLTGPQKNAIRAAKQYLSFKGFSRDGLIDQLSSQFGNGFDVDDATVAVDSLNIDWNEQAVKSARAYLDLMGFSCTGLIQQLSSSAGDQFTESQAIYGARGAGAC